MEGAANTTTTHRQNARETVATRLAIASAVEKILKWL